MSANLEEAEPSNKRLKRELNDNSIHLNVRKRNGSSKYLSSKNDNVSVDYLLAFASHKIFTKQEEKKTHANFFRFFEFR